MCVCNRASQKSVCTSEELLEMQTCAFKTLVHAFRKIDPLLQRAFMVKALSVIFGEPGLDELPMMTLAQLLLAMLEGLTEPRQILAVQNVMIFESHQLEVGGEYRRSDRCFQAASPVAKAECATYFVDHGRL